MPFRARPSRSVGLPDPVVTEPLRPNTTLRASSSLISFWCAVGLAAFLMGDSAVRGRWDIVGRWLPAILLILWCLWLFFYRSAVTLKTDRLVVTNLARVHDIPWRHVDAVVDSPQLTIQLDDGTRVTCWGGPFPGRAGRNRVGDELGPVLGAIEARREAASASLDPVRRRWDLPVLIAGVILAVAVVTAATLG